MAYPYGQPMPPYGAPPAPVGMAYGPPPGAPYGYASAPYPAPGGYPATVSGVYPAPMMPYPMGYPSAAYPAPGVTPYPAPLVGAQSPMAHMSQTYTLQLRGRRLDRKDVFSKSDPFFIISAATSGYMGKSGSKKAQKEAKKMQKNKKFKDVRGKWSAVYKSEVIKNDHNPNWRPFQVNLYTLCKNNIDTPFIIEVWDWDPNGNHDFIGRCTTNLRELQVMKEVQLINKHRFGLSSVAGLIEVVKCGP